MALPLPTQGRPELQQGSTIRPASSSQLAADAASQLFGPSCSLTIFKGSSDSHISAHNPIAHKSDESQQSGRRSRFANTFAGLGQLQHKQDNGETVNIHAVTEDGVLLPFIDRSIEVEELLFRTKANDALMQRLCRVFGGDIGRPTQRGLSEAWDEFLEIFLGTDRPILDDEDWLLRLEAITMDRSEELWAQLQRCLGADGLLLDARGHSTSMRYDTWADIDALSETDSVSPGSGPATPISELGGEGRAPISSDDVRVDVQALHALPSCYYKQPAGQLRRSSVHEVDFEMKLNVPGSSPRDEENPRLDDGRMSHSPSGHFGEPLADIIEEPSKTTVGEGKPRECSSGKFAGLRIHATAPHHHGRLRASPLSPAFSHDYMSGPMSPSSAGAVSPALSQKSPSVTGDDGPMSRSTSFSRPRRLSLLLPSGGGDRHHQNQHQQHHVETKEQSLKSAVANAHPGPLAPPSPAGNNLSPDAPRQPRRRAMSFARSFAELHPSERCHRALTASRGDGLSLRAQRPKMRHKKSHSISHAHGDVVSGLGLLPEGKLPLSSTDTQQRARAASVADPEERQRRSPFSDHGRAMSDKGDSSPPIPGLLPDGRTRHPSGSFGSKDLSESIAAFRATMGLSTSPTGGGVKERALSKEDASPTGAATATTTTKPSEPPAAAADEGSKPESNASLPKEIPTKASPLSDTRSAPRTDLPKPRPQPAGGSGLALGGGFSLAKSGANFKRPEAGSGRSSSGQLGPTSCYAGRGPVDSFHSPPPVHRRPGGFASLAQEYETARRSRRMTAGSVGSIFSFHSNAILSSPDSSVASLDSETPLKANIYHEGDERNHLMSPASRIHEWSTRKPTSPAVRPFGPTAAETPGQSTPRASMSTTVGFTPSQFPFPPTSAGAAPSAAETQRAAGEADRPKTNSNGNTHPASSPEAARPQGLAPSSNAACFSPRACPLVFPISSDPTVSRARQLEERLQSSEGESARQRIATVCGKDVLERIEELIKTTERQDLPDEALLETIGQKVRLVDHERARNLGGKEQDEADQILAEKGYANRWDAFAKLCQALGVGNFEISLAKRRCGPAIELC
ncbi:hypothetical protein ACQY0O_001021 [Thecaphora frezii]